MLKIYNPMNPTDVIPFPIDDDKRFVIHKYNGYDVLQFEIESNNPLYQYITEEGKIEDEKNRYVVKTIDEHSTFVTVKCELDLDDWKQEIVYEFRTTNKALSDVVAMILPVGWIVRGDGQFTKRTTVEGNEGEPLSAVTHLEILDAAAEAYSCVFNFDVLNRTLNCIDPTTYKPSGQFFTDELNLKSIGFVGSTSEGFATRLYAFGKKDEDGNPLTFASINGGKSYVEDRTYTDKVVCVGWSDERYSTQEGLLAAAKAKLSELSFPSRSYTCEAQNLNEDVWMYKMVTLIDRRRKTRVNHQIVEWKEYPKHALDSITLSKTVNNIESNVDKLKNDINVKIDEEKSTMQQILQAAIDNATDKITGNKGGSFCWVYDQDDKPIELLNLGDTDDVNTAKSVWRWNAAGLGHSNTGYDGAYALALLADGSINADVITAGTLNANVIRAGKLTDVKGNNYWDLETGEFKLSYSAAITSPGGDISVGDLAEGNTLTQEQIYNKLTNNGANKGIYMQDGELYVNATYLATGILSDAKGLNYWNLATGEFKLSSSTKVADNGIEKPLSEYLDVDVDLTQANVFNALTNNGKNKGIYMQNGELYINATYLAAGTLSDVGGNTTWNLETGELYSKRLSIDSTNFKLDAEGRVTMTDANVSGVVSSVSKDVFGSYGYYGTVMDSGRLLITRSKKADNSEAEVCGRIEPYCFAYVDQGRSRSYHGLGIYFNGAFRVRDIETDKNLFEFKNADDGYGTWLRIGADLVTFGALTTVDLINCNVISDHPLYVDNQKTYTGSLPVAEGHNYTINVVNGLITGWS